MDSVTHEHSVGTYLCPVRKRYLWALSVCNEWTEMDVALGDMWGVGTVGETLGLLRGHLPVLPKPVSFPASLAWHDVTLGWPGFPACP